MTAAAKQALAGGACDALALRALASSARPPCVSLFIPTEPFPEAAANAVRARHAVETAAKRLAELPVDDETSARMGELIAAIPETIGARPQPRGTLVAFVDRERVRLAPLGVSLPLRVVVGAAFSFRPLLRALAIESRYRVLAVSMRRVALYEGDSRGLAPAPAPGIPKSLEDALGSELTEKEHRLRGTAAGGGAPVHYSHGDAATERKLDAERFHHVLGCAVARQLRGDRTPLVLAADVTHQAGLRATLRVTGLLEAGVIASPDALAATELHARAWPLVAAELRRRERETLERWERARGRRRGVELLDEVARAVATGRVRTLWIEEDAALAGRVDPATGDLLDAPGDDDVFDHLTSLALAMGGEVHIVEPGELGCASGVAAEIH